MTNLPAITITVLGGSGAFTPELAYAISEWKDARPPIRLVLHGRDETKLQRVANACRRIADGQAPPLLVEAQTDLSRALHGAEYIVNQIRVGGLAARAQDETFPHAFGLPGEETVGAGGFANALRTLPVIRTIAQEVLSAAPNATVINLTNPASVVCQALCRAGLKRVIGVCDAPLSLAATLARLVELPLDRLAYTYVGINHIGWATALCDDSTDLLPLALARASRVDGAAIDPAVLVATGVMPNSYLRYLYHPDRMLAAQQGRPARAAAVQAMETALLEEYAAPGAEPRPELLRRRGALWYHLVIVPLLAASVTGHPTVQVVNVPNGTLLPWLPVDTTVEVPALVDSSGVRPLAVTLSQPDLQAILLAQAAYETLTIQAVEEASWTTALRALVANPFIATVDQARGILDAVWPTGFVRQPGDSTAPASTV